MSTARNTVLQNAMSRTSRFNKIITADGKNKILKIGNSYYRIFLEFDEQTSVIEVLNKKIISINGKGSYKIDADDYFVAETIGEVNLIIDFYDSFELSISSSSETNLLSAESNDLTYRASTVLSDAYAEKLEVSEVQASTIVCNKIEIGAWKFQLNGTDVSIGLK